MAVSKITRTLTFTLGYVPTVTEWTSEFDKPYNAINTVIDLINGTTTIDNAVVMTGSYTKFLKIGTIRIWDNAGVLFLKVGSNPASITDGVAIATGGLT